MKNKNKNGFLITWISSIVVLLVFIVCLFLNKEEDNDNNDNNNIGVMEETVEQKQNKDEILIDENMIVEDAIADDVVDELDADVVDNDFKIMEIEQEFIFMVGVRLWKKFI